jgi:hypothetical protein
MRGVLGHILKCLKRIQIQKTYLPSAWSAKKAFMTFQYREPTSNAVHDFRGRRPANQNNVRNVRMDSWPTRVALLVTSRAILSKHASLLVAISNGECPHVLAKAIQGSSKKSHSDLSQSRSSGTLDLTGLDESQ